MSGAFHRPRHRLAAVLAAALCLLPALAGAQEAASGEPPPKPAVKTNLAEAVKESSPLAQVDLDGLTELLPAPLVEIRALDVELWQWIALLVLVVVAWLFSWAFSTLTIRIARPLFTRTKTDWDDRLVELVQSPVRLALGVVFFSATTAPLDLTAGVEGFLVAAEEALLIVAAAWILLRLVDLATLTIRSKLSGEPGASAFLSPGKKTVKVVIVILAGIALLGNLGFNVTALIAGFGVGGIAVALAAQRSVEHLFGGVMLFTDQPVRVGDFCRFGDRVGTVEEIGLRSTRVRTLDRTVVTIPNSSFASMELENFTKRDRIRLFCILGLRYETSPGQLRYCLARLREMLLAHPKIDPDPARVRFVEFNAYSLDLEVFAYAKTADWNEFLQIREDVFLRIMDIVEESGTGFAFPSNTTYIGRDEGLDEKRTREAEGRVEAWRAEGRLPFPEFAQADREKFEDSLDWPPAGSPGGRATGGDGKGRG